MAGFSFAIPLVKVIYFVLIGVLLSCVLLLFLSCVFIDVLLRRNNKRYISSIVSVCPSVCLYVCLSLCQTITFESYDVKSSYLHILYISRVKFLYMKVIGSRSRSQEHKTSEIHIPIKLPSTTTPPSRNVKSPSAKMLPTHLRVVGLRFESSLVEIVHL